MSKIEKHPILDVPQTKKVQFKYNGKIVEGEKGFTIAAALHNAGYPVHSHSETGRNRTMQCGIGKCGACEMLVDGIVRRICITKVDEVKEVCEVPKNHKAENINKQKNQATEVYYTDVVIIGAGPAGLAAREILNENGVSNLVIDNNEKIGGQFNMQTHQFFFFEKEKKYGGMRGFDIASTLAGKNHDGILLNSSVWDILEGGKIAVKNIKTEEIYYVIAKNLIVASGAVPFMPAFENDDVPGVYTAAVIQKMMNTEFTLLGKRILTVGAGNIGYLTSYQLMQAGAKVVGIIEAQSHEGGFPVQANRVRRLGIPIMLNHVLVRAIPNADYTGITGAVIAECHNFKIVPGTEKIINNIDAINICTGLISDNQLLKKGYEVFGRSCYGVGDAVRIGEGTTAVLKGKQAAYEILDATSKRFNYDLYVATSKQYFDSLQRPEQKLDKPFTPNNERAKMPFVQLDCLYAFACNPCSFACPHGAISKSSTNTTPQIDYTKCIGCMQCVYQCPGLAIFGYNIPKDQLFLPIEYAANEGDEVFLVNNNGQKLGEGFIEKIMIKPNKTNVARVKSNTLHGDDLRNVRGFIVKENYPQPLELCDLSNPKEEEMFVCHCDDVKLESLLKVIGDRKFISIDELKHNTRIGMGPCRGKRCIPRAKTLLRQYGIEITGDATPRGPLSNQLNLGELYPNNKHEKNISPTNKTEKTIKVKALVAGGGMAGSSVFRYMSEAGFNPILVNDERGSSWRNIAGGRPAFSHPAIADLAMHNLEIFKSLQQIKNIDYKPTRYVSFAHDEENYRALEASIAWSDAYMVEKKNFCKEISQHFNPNLDIYSHALISHNCWQATPGKTIDLVRTIGKNAGGIVLENSKIIDVEKSGKSYRVLVQNNEGNFVIYETDLFVNALGANAEKIAHKLGIETGLFPVKHQAFITRRMPLIGRNGDSLDMLIDRRKYKGFSAVYGQQLAETGQIIGCASPAVDSMEAGNNLKVNTQDFLKIVAEVFVDWIPELAHVGIQATWAGYYTEPRYIIDPELGLCVGLRGHGFMLSQYIGKLYVEKLLGHQVPDYFDKLKLAGEGLSESAFK